MLNKTGAQLRAQTLLQSRITATGILLVHRRWDEPAGI
jgi:hypothetical protein